MYEIHYTKKFLEGIEGDPRRDLAMKYLKRLPNINNPQNLNSYDQYYEGILALKLKKSNSCRIVIQPHTVKISMDGREEEEVRVLFVREFIGKKNFDYKWATVIQPQLSKGIWSTFNPLPESEIIAFKKSYEDKHRKIEKALSPPPSELLAWLEEFKIKLRLDIYENQKWVEYSNDRSQQGLSERWVIIFQGIFKHLLSLEPNPDVVIAPISSTTQIKTAIDTRHNVGIVFHEFLYREFPVFVVHDGAELSLQQDRWKEALTSAQSIDFSLLDSIEEVSRNAFRAYPKWILNFDLWSALQRHEGMNNLSLLPEQIDFLRGFRFPSYIKGQAGSGKSTMLYYLFANTYLYQKDESLPGKIIFLTENEELLEKTQSAVIGLLSDNPEFNLDLDVATHHQIRSCFLSFKEFLLRYLPKEERGQFTEINYLDFPRFKEQYLKYHNLNYSAEESWFVITTYIKGYFEDRDIDSLESYRDSANGIPRDFRIVSDDHFQGIVNEALPIYNRLLEEGRWDKLRIVKRIREIYPDRLPQTFTAVFCDEAQDFSRIELGLIIDSSEYTHYDLSTITQVPIVIAGDSLQTVSPTGFSDTRLHQMYFDALKEKGFSYNKKASTYKPSYNYRSIEPIVRIANIIQNYRKEGLNEVDTEEQKAKRKGTSLQKPILHQTEWISSPPQFDEFIKKFKYKTFIVPVDLNEEEDYRAKHNLLSQNNFQDVKSSVASKGSEYSEVVLYGFGQHYLDEFHSLDWSENDQGFSKKFFFNKLYVAVTRAQNELTIIDSSEAIIRFWKPLFSKAANTIGHDPSQQLDISDFILVEPESGLKDIIESSPEDALQNAKNDLDLGYRDRNVSRLMVAKSIFLAIGKENLAFESEARIYEIKGDYEKSGKSWENAGRFDLATQAYFKGRFWNQFERIAFKIDSQIQDARKLVLSLMRSNSWNDKEVLQANHLRDSISESVKEILWRKEFVNRITEFASLEDHGQQTTRDLAYILHAIIKEDEKSLLKILGVLYYRTRQYDEAIKVWEEYFWYIRDKDIDPSDLPEYTMAQIKSAEDRRDLHDEILWGGRYIPLEKDPVQRLRLAKHIIDFTVNHPDQILSSEVKDQLLRSIHFAFIIAADTSQTVAYAKEIENDSNVDSDQLLSHYRKSIHLAEDEIVSIFLKERWAKNHYNYLLKGKPEEEAIELLNDAFMEEGFPFEDSNLDWTIAEVGNISDQPELRFQTPDGHFQRIIVRHFKKFKELDIPNIGQFNLILGDNNSGKTTLLEALLFSPNPSESLRNFAYAEFQRNNHPSGEYQTPIFERIIDSYGKFNAIDYRIINGRRSWIYKIRLPKISEFQENEVLTDIDVRQYLAIEGGGATQVAISRSFAEIQNDLKDPKRFGEVPFIPFGKGYSENLSLVYLNTVAKDRKAKGQFYEDLKLFIPNLVEVTPDSGNNRILITEELNSEDINLPLHSYGEGANKLFRVLVQLHASENGRLMIDEIDAGIHYSKMKRFWQIILKIAKTRNVQIFATTHNDEYISSLWGALNDEDFISYRGDSRIITLDRHTQTGEIVPIVRNWDAFTYANENNIETRGRSRN